MVVIAGATGIGKTELSIQLADRLHAEIVSADSRQVYRELKIGTAAPGPLDLQRVPHHFIGNKSIHDYYSAGIYEQEVLRLLPELFRNNPFVLLTGGSGLYINAVCQGIDNLPDPDPEIREKLINQFEKEGIESLRFDLKRIDPEYYRQADLYNPKRLLKALEIYLQTGKTYTSFLTRTNKKRPFRIIKICLQRDRNQLYDRINRRVDQMMQDGLADEALQYHQFKHLNALNTVGYKELFPVFEKKYPQSEAVRLIKRNSRRYAKKQISWFAGDPEMKHFHPEDEEQILQYITQQSKQNLPEPF